MSDIQREQSSPTWQQLLDEGSALLREAGIAEADLDAWYLLEEAFKVDRVHFFMERSHPVRTERLEAGYPLYQESLERRAQRIPLQHILGKQGFMGLEFYVNENVLIPRQDTETLVEEVLKCEKEKDISILDMCTGSGCIAISLSVLGGYRSVTAADISAEALKVAKKNARRLFLVQKGTVKAKSTLLSEEPWHLELQTQTGTKTVPSEEVPVPVRKMNLIRSDLFREFSPDVKFDVIVSNPPYIPSNVIEGLEPEVRDHEPRLALDGCGDGLMFYRILALECTKHLNPGGCVYFEIGFDQAEEVSMFLARAGYREIETVKDEPGLDRVVKARWNG